MKTRWKSTLWSLGPAAYLAGVTILSYNLLWILPRAFWGVSLLWVGLLAAGAWQLTRRGRKMAGRIMAAATVLAAMFSVFMGSVHSY